MSTSNGNRIQEIADELANSGAEVTASAVRQAMDHRESYSKIFRELEAWKKSRPVQAKAVDAPVLEDVETTLKSVMHVIWHAGAIEARAELQRLRDEAERESVQLRRDLADSLQEVASLENDVAFHTRKLDELSTSLQKAEAALTTRETEASALRQHVADISQQQRMLIEKVERLASRAAAAETELRNARGITTQSREIFDEEGHASPH